MSIIIISCCDYRYRQIEMKDVYSVSGSDTPGHITPLNGYTLQWFIDRRAMVNESNFITRTP